MSSPSFAVGALVEHVSCPEWGPGKILDLYAATVTVYFRDYPEHKPGDAVKKIQQNFLRLAETQSDPWLDNLPPLKNGSLGFARARMTLDQAVVFFQRKFPLGFNDHEYFGDTKDGERHYKLRQHDLYLQLFGNEVSQEILLKNDIDEIARRALRLFSINLLHPQEQIKVREALQNKTATKQFFHCLFALISKEGVDRYLFEDYLVSAANLQVIKGKRVATWPVVTLLPFLADPARFMFLKPEPTLQAAERLAFDLHYDPTPNWETYDCLLHMSKLLMDKLQPLGARDWIDVQSFMWVISENYY
jgi:hypothetical protein